jgi:glycosyltransferase involved in cell wall biosynthesis
MVANVLLLCDGRPDPRALGGVQVHVAALARWAPPPVKVLTAHVEGGNRLVVEGWRPSRHTVAEVPFTRATLDPTEEDPALRRALEVAVAAAGANVLHVHTPGLGPRTVASAADRLGVPLVVTLHEHALVCEEYRLLELGHRFCDIPEDLRRCDRCLATTHGRPSGFISRWRSAMAVLADRADAVIVPSRSALELSARVHPVLRAKATLLPWGVPPAADQCIPGLDPRQPLRIGGVGVLAPVKGTELLTTLVEATAHLHVEWHWFGATEGKRLRAPRGQPKVRLHGAYARERLARELNRARIDVVLLPSIAPETFSLTLSEVLAAGLPVIASDLGALGERVDAAGAGWTVDVHDAGHLAAVLETLTRDRTLLVKHAERVRALPHRSESDMARDHAAVWERVATQSRLPAAGAWTDARAGADAARRQRPASETLPLRALRAVRQSRVYRDLRLRTLLSESTRRALLDRVHRILKR